MGEKYDELLAAYERDVKPHILEARRLYERLQTLEKTRDALVERLETVERRCDQIEREADNAIRAVNTITERLPTLACDDTSVHGLWKRCDTLQATVEKMNDHMRSVGVDKDTMKEQLHRYAIADTKRCEEAAALKRQVAPLLSMVAALAPKPEPEKKRRK